MSAAANAFYGVWILDPAESRYAEGDPPREAVYTIAPGDGETVSFCVAWSDVAGAPHSVAFSMLPDGARRAAEGAQPGVELACALEESGELTTEVWFDGRLAQRASRALTDGGRSLVLVQREPGPDGLREVVRALYRRSPIKQVLLYRRDLKMRKGKIAAQIAHASMAVFFRRDAGVGDRMQIPLSPPMAIWVRSRFAKIVLSVEGEEDLLRAYEAAREAGLACALITDSGRTEFGGVPTRTAVAIGPDAACRIDPITGREGLVATKLA